MTDNEPITEVAEDDFGSFIKRAREAAGLTQMQVSAALKVAQPTISYWESGRALPSSQNVVPVAELYGIDPLETLRRMKFARDRKRPVPA